MVVVFIASLATGFCQNGVFAFVSGFGVSEYTQAIMTGQAVAGVLPCIVQIISVLSVPERDAQGAGQESPKSALAYFLTATGVSVVTLVAFTYLLRRQRNNNDAKQIVESVDGAEALEHAERKVVGMVTLFKKLRWLAMGVIICFTVTIATFPVFTAEIESVHTQSTSSRLFSPACFIPLAFLAWNVGDLAGRLLPLIPKLSLVHHTPLAFTISLSRVVFIPLYLLCNIRGRGAIISSDVFYLFVVQFLFGLTNGYIGSSCMIGASEWVEDDEREAAGGFMGLMLVFGLTLGSFFSFLTANA